MKEKIIAYTHLDTSSLSPRWAFSFPHSTPVTFFFFLSSLSLLSSVLWLSQGAQEHLIISYLFGLPELSQISTYKLTSLNICPLSDLLRLLPRAPARVWPP